MSPQTSRNAARNALLGLGALSLSGGLLLMLAMTGLAGGNPLACLLVGNAAAGLGAALVIFAEPCARLLGAIKR